MSEKAKSEDGAGCLFVIAAIIIGGAIGSLSQAEYGWLTVGGIFLIWALAAAG